MFRNPLICGTKPNHLSYATKLESTGRARCSRPLHHPGACPRRRPSPWERLDHFTTFDKP